MTRTRFPAPRRSVDSGAAVPEGSGSQQPPTADSAGDSYCPGCGHDWPNHRRGKCWTGAMGEPLTRTRTLIDCDCKETAP